MKKDDLWEKYAKNKDQAIKQKLIEEYVGLVKIVAGRMYNFYGSKIEYDDLVSYGVIGLIDSIDRFDLSKNIKFETYAQIRIKGTIIDNIRKLDWIPRTLRKKSKDIKNAISDLENKLGRSPSKIEISTYLQMDLKEVESVMADIETFNISSLEEMLLSRGEYSIDEGPDSMVPEHIVEKEEVKKILGQIINQLPENEKMVISLYYYNELTYKEIGRILDLSESRISQIHSKAIKRMKNQLITRDVY